MNAPRDVEVELAKERAEALGRAGHALGDAVRAYHVAIRRAYQVPEAAFRRL